MNLDYIELTNFLGKDKLCLDNLQWYGNYYDWKYYYLNGNRKLKVHYHESMNQVKLEGSIPYFIKGYNYFSTLIEWKEALEYINNCLNLNTFSWTVDCFEFGIIQEINIKEEEFLRNHIGIKGMQTKPYLEGKVLTGKEFDSSILKVKLYDVNRNIKNKLDLVIREELSRLYGWNKQNHYIKLENHYKKPEKHFKRNVYMNELLSSDFQAILKKDLLHSYESILKTGKTIIPANKKDINAGTIPLIILKDLESIYGFNTEDLIKGKLKEIPEAIFSLSDRKARQKILRENLRKIKTIGKSEYDIVELLEASLLEEQKEVLLYV